MGGGWKGTPYITLYTFSLSISATIIRQMVTPPKMKEGVVGSSILLIVFAIKQLSIITTHQPIKVNFRVIKFAFLGKNPSLSLVTQLNGTYGIKKRQNKSNFVLPSLVMKF